MTQGKQELKLFQQFIVKYMSSDNNNSILLFVGTGSGKSAIAVSLYNEIYNKSPLYEKNLIINPNFIDNNYNIISMHKNIDFFSNIK